MLVTSKYLLNMAEKKNQAIGAFNVTGLSTLLAILEVAQELKEPVILEFAQTHEEEKVMDLDSIGPVMVALAKQAKVPVAVHLDHGIDYNYIEKALEMGFTSVMYDGSSLPLEENIENTKKVVTLASKYGASVEAEIGKMAGITMNNNNVIENREVDRSNFTDPMEAKQFVKETGVDMLACSFGTSHGLYTSAPQLDSALVAELRIATGIPVVMHGGSGVSEEDYYRVIDSGVRKINYYSYMAKAGGEAIRSYLQKEGVVFYHELANVAKEAMKENVKEAIVLFKNNQGEV